MSLLKKLAGETAIYGGATIIARLLNYAMTPFYTYVVFAGRKAEFGTVSEIFAYTGFLIILFTYRMETGFFRFAKDKEQEQRVFATTATQLLLTTPIIVGTLIAFSSQIADWIAYPEHPDYVVYVAMILGLDALCAIPFARLRLQGRPVRFAAIKIVNVVTNILANVFFLWLCPKLLTSGYTWVEAIYTPGYDVGYVFVSNMIASGVTLLLLLPHYLKVQLRYEWPLMRRVLSYTLPLVPIGLAGMVNELLDRVLLKWLLPGGPEANLSEVGVYAANYKVAVLMTMFTMAFNYAAEPFFFNNADREDAKQLYGRVALAFVIVGCVVFVGITGYLDVALLLVESTYREGRIIVPIVLMANLFLGLYYNLAVWYKLTDRTGFGAWVAISGALLTILLNVWLVPIYGYVVSAWATLACYVFMTVVSYLLSRRYYPVEYPVGSMIFYLLVALVAYGIFFWLEYHSGITDTLRYVLNTIVVLAFMAMIYLRERKGLIRELRTT